jgi:hypothetical protein
MEFLEVPTEFSLKASWVKLTATIEWPLPSERSNVMNCRFWPDIPTETGHST